MRAWPGAKPNVLLRKNTAAPCARGLNLLKKIHVFDLRFRHVCSLPGAVVQLLSQSPHLHACTPKLSFTRLP
jgi:hypothetical protein